MSGQEGTRPLQLSTAARFTPDRGSAPNGHPDNAITPAARDKLVSEEVGSLLSRSLIPRCEEPENVGGRLTAEDAAAALASLSVNREAQQLRGSEENLVPVNLYFPSPPVQSEAIVHDTMEHMSYRAECPSERPTYADEPPRDVVSTSFSQNSGGRCRDIFDIRSDDLLASGNVNSSENLPYPLCPMPSEIRHDLVTTAPSSQLPTASNGAKTVTGQSSSDVSANLTRAISQIVADALRPIISAASSQSLTQNSSLQSHELYSAYPGDVRGIRGTVPSTDVLSCGAHVRNDGPVVSSMSVENVRRSKREVMKPQSFDGKEPINSFLAHFQVCAEFNDWSESEKRLWLQWSLKGRAQQMLWDLPSDQTSSYRSIVEALRRRFGSDQQSEVYRIQLRNRRRGTHESLSDLMQDIRRLMVLAYSSTTSSIWESVATNAFLDALGDPVLALEIRKRGPSTLEAAYRDALLLEGYIQSSMPGGCEQGRGGQKISAKSAAAVSVKSQKNEYSRREEEWRKELNDVRSELNEQLSRQNGTIQQLLQQLQNAEPSVFRQERTNGNGGRTVVEKPVSRNGCYNCGIDGHFARNCPYPPNSMSTDQQNFPTRSENNGRFLNDNRTRNRLVSCANTAYLPVEIDGMKRWCLLDSGSQTTIVPSWVVQGYPLQQSEKILTAANGSEIRIAGETTLSIVLGELTILTKCLVTDFVDEIMLGLEWLEENQCIWNFGHRTITIGDCTFSLYAHRPTWNVRRVILSEPVRMNPLSEQDVVADVVFSSLSPSVCDWVTQASEPKKGVRIARTLVDNKTSQVRLRMINTNKDEASLPKGMPLCRLEEALVVSDVSEQPADSSERDCSHIDALLNTVDDSVSEDDVERLRKVLVDNAEVFSTGDFDLGCTSKVVHRIDTAGNKPVRQALRRQPLSLLKTVDEQLDQMQEAGIIEPVQSEWAANIVIVKKKDGSVRFCVDYRGLNDRTVKDSYPLPRIDDCLDSLANVVWFSTFDLRSGYHQVTVEPSDVHKTAFVTRRGTFAFRVMPFGLCNAPATFQRLMDCVMLGLNFEICLVYLDDIILFSRTVEEHLSRLKILFGRLREANLKLKPSKCHLMRRSVEFLGYVVSSDGIATDSKKTEAVQQWPVPRNIKEVRGFVGLCSYYRKFVPNFASIAEPLHALTRKNTRFSWTSDCQVAFESLKKKLTESPVLSLPRDEGKFILDTDASDCSIGAVLSQEQDGEEKVLAYASRLYSKAERNYCVTRKELLAVVYFMKQFRQYLLGRQFTVRTDHSALQWLRKTPEPIGQQGRWLEVLEEFDFNVCHRPGRQHVNADALSRKPCKQCGHCPSDLDVLAGRATRQEVTEPMNQLVEKDHTLAELQRNDNDIAPIYESLASGTEAPEWDSMLPCSQISKIYWTKYLSLEMHNGVIYMRQNDEDGSSKLRLLAPKTIHEELIHQAHAGFSGGHMGRRRTLEQVRRRAYWAGWSKDVRRYVHSCPECASYKRGRPPQQGPLQHMLTGEPWERIGVDITGPHPKSRNGYVYILTMVDYFSKWAHAFPLRNQEATTIAKILIDKVFAYFGTPLQILTDRGRNFQSEVFNEMCKRFDIDHVSTTAYKPSTNGLVERFHQTLNSILGKVVTENQRDWDDHLAYALAAYRATPHETTGYSPNMLFLGRENRAPIDLLYGCPENDEHFNSAHDFIAKRQCEIRRRYADVREKTKKAAERQKKFYDLRLHIQSFKPGDSVWYFYPRRRMGRSPKWQKWYTGPYLVVERVGPVNYKIQRTKRSVPIVVHVDKLKLCEQKEPLARLPGTSNSKPIETESAAQPDQPPVNKTCDEGINTTDTSDVKCRRPQRTHRLPERYRNNRTYVAAFCNCVDMDRQLLFRKCSKSFCSMKALRSHLRAVHRPTKGGTAVSEAHEVVVAATTESMAISKESTKTVPMPSTQDEKLRQSLREAEVQKNRVIIQQLIAATKKLIDNDVDSIKRPSAQLVAELRRVPGADHLSREVILAVILTARSFAVNKDPGLNVPMPHPEGRRDDCKMCRSPLKDLQCSSDIQRPPVPRPRRRQLPTIGPPDSHKRCRRETSPSTASSPDLQQFAV